MSDVINEEFVIRNPSELKPHWVNVAVYEEQEEQEIDDALMESIKEQGQLEPIVIKEDNTIISGRRRCLILKALGQTEAKCRIIRFDDNIEELEAVVAFNRHRPKKPSQIYNEASAMQLAITERAHRRQQGTQLSGKNENGYYQTKGSVMPNLASPNEEKGSTIENLARKMEMKKTNLSKILRIGDSVRAGRPIGKFAMKRLDSGEASVDAAYMAVELDKLAQDGNETARIQVEKVLKGEITPKRAMNELRWRKKRDAIRVHDAGKLPDEKYNVILCDPPWKAESRPEYSAENHYPTMELDEIKKLKVPAAENSVLFLWTTISSIRDSFDVLDAWGFEYKAMAVWDKGYSGLGSWFRNQHEILLLGTKGKWGVPEKENRFSSVISVKKTQKHSEKPKCIYKMIEKMYPGQKYFEMFAREAQTGWACWGNQAPTEKDD